MPLREQSRTCSRLMATTSAMPRRYLTRLDDRLTGGSQASTALAPGGVAGGTGEADACTHISNQVWTRACLGLLHWCSQGRGLHHRVGFLRQAPCQACVLKPNTRRPSCLQGIMFTEILLGRLVAQSCCLCTFDLCLTRCHSRLAITPCTLWRPGSTAPSLNAVPGWLASSTPPKA